MTSPSDFPIPKPARLPLKISPCPIVEAVVEIRFVSTESWRNMPGMLHPRIRSHYPESKELPLASMPDDMRTKDPSFTWEPLLQYGGSAFSIQFGPRVISLITRPHHYPGWSCFEEELAWVFEQLEASGIISEIERIGLRYVDFFENDVWHPGGDGNHFSDGLVRVKRLHDTSKEIFFGLLKPEILATMNPVYPAT